MYDQQASQTDLLLLIRSCLKKRNELDHLEKMLAKCIHQGVSYRPMDLTTKSSNVVHIKWNPKQLQKVNLRCHHSYRRILQR